MNPNCQTDEFVPKSTVQKLLKDQEEHFKMQLQQQYEYFERMLSNLNKENSSEPTVDFTGQHERHNNERFDSYLNADLNNPELFKDNEEFRDRVKQQIERSNSDLTNTFYPASLSRILSLNSSADKSNANTKESKPTIQMNNNKPLKSILKDSNTCSQKNLLLVKIAQNKSNTEKKSTQNYQSKGKKKTKTDKKFEIHKRLNDFRNMSLKMNPTAINNTNQSKVYLDHISSLCSTSSRKVMSNYSNSSKSHLSRTPREIQGQQPDTRDQIQNKIRYSSGKKQEAELSDENSVEDQRQNIINGCLQQMRLNNQLIYSNPKFNDRNEQQTEFKWIPDLNQTRRFNRKISKSMVNKRRK